MPLFCEKNTPSKQTIARFSRKLVTPTRISNCIETNGSDDARWSNSIHGEVMALEGDM